MHSKDSGHKDKNDLLTLRSKIQLPDDLFNLQYTVYIVYNNIR